MHIIVVGAGVTGIACAHNFLKRGHNVTLIEKDMFLLRFKGLWRPVNN